MDPAAIPVNKTLFENALSWFRANILHAKLLSPIQSQFPNYALPSEIQNIVQGSQQLADEISRWPGEAMSFAQTRTKLEAVQANHQPLLKQIILRYRRERAAYTETKTEMTFHLELLKTLEEEVKVLDALANEQWFQEIELVPLPRLNDFLPVQYIESAFADQAPLAPRQYDEKFHILQAPSLFLPDLAYFRAKCEARVMPLAIAFLDIDHFKQFNSKHTETKVDRNLLPRFMQAIEAHVFHHGYAYRQGGDEYLILIPSLSKELAIAFLGELRGKLAQLQYPDIDGNTTVSIGLCIVEPDCPLTDRELRDRASLAKNFAKDNGRDCIAWYDGPRFIPDELCVVKQE